MSETDQKEEQEVDFSTTPSEEEKEALKELKKLVKNIIDEAKKKTPNSKFISSLEKDDLTYLRFLRLGGTPQAVCSLRIFQIF